MSVPRPFVVAPLLTLVLALLLGACAGSRSATGAQDPSAPTTASATSTTQADQGTSTAPAPEPEPEPGPPPVLALRGTPERGAGSVALVIENRGTELARVAPQLSLERAGADGSFEAVGSVRLSLRASCSADAPPCVELAPGAALHPPSWLGTEGDAQCGCEGCARVEPGRYRLVATSCGGAHRAEGEPFELAP